MIKISLPPEVEDRLKLEASRQGVGADEYARQLIIENLPESAEQPSISELFAAWEQEDRTNDADELSRRNKEWEELKRSLNRNRQEMEGPHSRQPGV